MARHRRRLSGPLLDRVDLVSHLQRDAAHDLHEAPLTSSQKARERVTDARERQAARLAGDGVSVNAHMDVRMLLRHVSLDFHGEALVRRARESGLLSARGQQRLLRVARTIADLDGSEHVRARHVGAALALRPESGAEGSRAA
jgi:magnesium chelatase family protein